MNYRVMDEVEIKIATIKNINHIYLYTLIDPKSYTENILATITVFYDKQQLTFCQNEKHFDYFFRKLRHQYNLEKFEHEIEIDESLKTIFNQNQNLSQNQEFNLFNNLNGVKSRKLYQEKEEFLKLKPILIDELTQIAAIKDIKINYNDDIKGIQNIYYLACKINGEEQIQICKFHKSRNDEFEITIGNFITSNNTIIMSINLNNNLSINFKWPQLKLSGCHSFVTENNEQLEKMEIYKNGDCIFFDIVPLNKLEAFKNEKIKKILNFYEITNFQIGILPWGDYRLIKNTKKENDKFEITEQNVIYIYQRKELLYLDYTKNKTIKNLENKLQLPCDNVHMESKWLDDIIETSFFESHTADSVYQSHLQGNNFYHLVQGDDYKFLPVLDEDKGYQLRKKNERSIIQKRGEQ